mmetsp:Transcript_5013/g.7243  ORF Transcript_5013/g.7243 Transcript_5013/m.7243 type:complete len:190 (-) Transcript_5013:109-678(-)
MAILMIAIVLAHAFLVCHQRRNHAPTNSLQSKSIPLRPPSIQQRNSQTIAQRLSVSLASSVLQDLEIIDTLEGTGDVAKFDSIVTIQYTGKILDSGEKFDTDSMISFKLGYGKVLQGCDTGIRGMKVGGIRMLKIPSRLGFGAEGMDGSVAPNTDLEYTIELLSVASGPMAETAANMGIGLNPKTVYLK